MKTLRQSTFIRDQSRANDFDGVRIEEVSQERCGLCWDRWPKSMMRDNDGVRRCPDCYEDRDQRRVNDILAYDNARRSARQTRPQKSLAPLDSSSPPFIRQMTDNSGRIVTAAAPLSMDSLSDTAVILVVTGGNFTSTDEFSYSNFITSNTFYPSLSGSTEWTLSLNPSLASTGLAHLTFNNHTYRNLLFVR